MVLAAVAAVSALPPVIFLPGFGGNPLYCRVDAHSSLPPSCRGVDPSLLPIGEDFMLLPASSLDKDHQPCLYALLTMTFDTVYEQFIPLEGVDVFPKHFGGFDGISPVYWEFARILQSWGYTLPINSSNATATTSSSSDNSGASGSGSSSSSSNGSVLYGAPYDYRYMSPSSLDRTGFAASLRTLVETAYQAGAGERVVIIGHSNGGPQMYSFLSDECTTQQWRDVYIAGMIGLSGNFLGQMNGYKSFFVTAKGPLGQARLAMAASWEASYGSCSWGDYSGLKEMGPIATTFVGSAAEANYTSSLADMSSLFTSAGHPDWANRLRVSYKIKGLMNRSEPPGCSVWCLYGRDLDTTYAFSFKGTIPAPQVDGVGFTNGDGNQDLVDNSFCETWRGRMGGGGGGSDKQYSFESQAFSGVEHMAMTSDPGVMQSVRDILEAL